MMHVKSVVEDIENEVVKKWGSLAECDCLEDINFNVIRLKGLYSRIKALEIDKKKISRSFGKKDISQIDREAIKEKMRSTSIELKKLEKQRKNFEVNLRVFFESDSESKAELPKRFCYEIPVSLNVDFRIQIVNQKQLASNCKENLECYIDGHSGASIYHLPRWQEIIHDIFSHESVNFIALDEQDQVRGILPASCLNSRLFGSFAVSMPYFNFGGPLADAQDIEVALLDEFRIYCNREKLGYGEIRATREINDWPKRTEKVTMILSLPDSQNKLDKMLGSKVRAQVKRANDFNLIANTGSTELLEDFYKVFAENMRDLGTPVYGKSFFKKILQQFSEASRLIIIYHGKKPISAAFLLVYKGVLEIPWASTLRRYNKLDANMFLYRTALGYAIDAGYDYFDFGRSSIDSGTYRFKKQWGAKPVQHYWHYSIGEDCAVPELNPSNPKYRLAISIWKRLPLWAANFIGPLVVKDIA